MNRKPHTLREFDRAMESMRETLAIMSTSSRYAFDLSMKALIESSEALADQCIADDQKIDQCELSIDQGVINIQAFFSPMASDMREVLTMMRISGLLERIGDDSVSIARRTKKILQYLPVADLYRFEPIYLSIRSLFSVLMSSYQQGDLAQIGALADRITPLVDECSALSDRMIAAAEQEPERIPVFAELIFVTRSMFGVLSSLRKIVEESTCYLEEE